MHQQVLQCLLHIRCAAALGIGYEARERHVLQHRLPYIVLEIFDLLGLEIGQHTNVFLEGSTMLFEEAFRAAQDLDLCFCVRLCLCHDVVCVSPCKWGL